jgi:hypothetical protein
MFLNTARRFGFGPVFFLRRFIHPPLDLTLVEPAATVLALETVVLSRKLDGDAAPMDFR